MTSAGYMQHCAAARATAPAIISRSKLSGGAGAARCDVVESTFFAPTGITAIAASKTCVASAR
jgi:hypothetical protein